ncbi:lysine--tRNA ligase [Patescibacteria group bacterium]|nr:lysine--tRNA ligase [Patescibacteria group bacterium]
MAFWADRTRQEIEDRFTAKISDKKPIIIRDEKTASGRMLVSAMRGALIHGVISELLSEKKIHNTFLWEINDTDAFRKVPKGLDEERYKEYLGMPLYRLPSPEEGAKNFPEYFAQEFIEVMGYLGFTPTYYRTSDAYRSGKFNEVIKIALEKASVIRGIYKKISGSIKDKDWLPLMVICEKCGKIGTTKTTSFDGEKVRYTCAKDTVTWADGCSHEGEVSPFDGNATLPFKVEWAAKFKVLEVDVEGGGKDLSTKGGARDVSNHISRDVFGYEPPYDIPYEFFLVEGKKMSTSKGNAPSAHEILDVLPPHIYRLVYLGKNYKQQIEFNIKGDTIPMLFDTYDRLADKYFGGVDDDDTRLFKFIHLPKMEIREKFLPRFSQIAFLVQMPHLNVEDEVRALKGEALTEDDQRVLEERMFYASAWLTTHAGEEYKFELKEEVPEGAKEFSDRQKRALAKVLVYIQSQDRLDGQEFHTKLHEIRKEEGIEAKDFFSALYVSFLGKESGPKAGWFLSVLDKNFLEERLGEVSK